MCSWPGATAYGESDLLERNVERLELGRNGRVTSSAVGAGIRRDHHPTGPGGLRDLGDDRRRIALPHHQRAIGGVGQLCEAPVQERDSRVSGGTEERRVEHEQRDDLTRRRRCEGWVVAEPQVAADPPDGRLPALGGHRSR